MVERKVEMDKPKGCSYYFSTLDNMILRPLLIYKYHPDSINDIDHIMELIAQDQNVL